MKRYRIWDEKSGVDVAYGITSDDENFRICDMGDYISIGAYDKEDIEDFLGTDDYELAIELLEDEV